MCGSYVKAAIYCCANLGSSTSRITNTKALLLNLYNIRVKNRDVRDSLTLIVLIDFKKSIQRCTCDVNVIFKNSVNLACLPIIANLYRGN